MSRLIFFIFALALGGCNHLGQRDDDKDSYVFHDDFYYASTDGGKCYLERCTDEYFLVIETAHRDEVLTELEKRNFRVTQGPVERSFLFDNNFERPDILKENTVLCIKGDGNIDDISHVVYSNTLYADENSQLIGRSNMLGVHYKDEEGYVRQLLEYAGQHKIHPVADYPDLNWFVFICTNESDGNPVEMANIFVEKYGFPMAQPDFAEYTLD